MAVDLNAIHQAVIDTIKAVQPKARCYPGYRDKPEPPCVIVHGDPESYVQMEMAMRQGTVAVNLTLLLLAGSDDRVGQEQVLRWLSCGTGQDESLANTLARTADGTPDRTLGGVIDGFTFGATRGPQPIEYPAGSGARFSAAELEIRAHVTGG